jgi:hypothetical protein
MTMAYMRGEPYVYSDGTHIHIYYEEGRAILPIEIMEELAAMIFFKIPEDRRREVLERTYENNAGNIGCDGVAVELGKDTSMETAKKLLKEGEVHSAPIAGDPGVPPA